MARYDNLVRLVRMVARLEESRAGIPLRVVGEELGVSERTARRYVEALRRGGYEIQDEGGRYRLPRPARGLGSLTTGQRRTLLLTAVAAAPLAGTPLVIHPSELSELLSAPPAQRDLFSRISLPLTSPSRLAIDYRKHEAILNTLLKAIEERSVVHAVYFTASTNETKTRDLDPYTFHYDPTLETLYVFAYCHLRNKVLSFAAHRFREATITRGVFAPQPDFSVASHLAGAFRMYRGTANVPAVVRFAPEVAARVAERKWHASQTVRDLPGGEVEISLVVDGYEEIVPWILGYGSKAVVVGPEGLVERVKAEVEGMGEAYGVGVARAPLRAAAKWLKRSTS